MPHHRYRLTPAVEQQITSYIRAGGYDWAFLSAGTPGTAEPPAGTVLDSGSDSC